MSHRVLGSGDQSSVPRSRPGIVSRFPVSLKNLFTLIVSSFFLSLTHLSLTDPPRLPVLIFLCFSFPFLFRAAPLNWVGWLGVFSRGGWGLMVVVRESVTTVSS